ncbi:MAG: HEPN domain-containing protein [Candidatus Alkaliphilus sp. MAG34]
MEYKNYGYWFEMAEYDYQTAIAMFNTKRYLYVGFMLHQTIEKAFKGYYVFLKSEIPPFTHSLLKLSQQGTFYDSIPEDLRDVIDILEPLNIEARYPSDKEKLINELDEEFCKRLLKHTEELYKWIIKKLPKKSIDL